MKSRVYQIFKECFPELPVTEDNFYCMFDYEGYEFIAKYDAEQLIGFSALLGNRILLLCVAPKYQGKGYGKQLVKESEERIRENGHHTVVLGGTDSKFFLGAPTKEEPWRNRHNYFFEACGYTADHGCLEMIMELKDYHPNQLMIPLELPGITFRYWDKKDKTELMAAVEKVEEDWVQYFKYDIPIYVAMEKNRLVGFTILSFNDKTLYSNESNIVGMVGCVGVIPDSRSKGIGLAMVAHATHELIKNGCTHSYIHYTYLDQWYGQLGYQTFLYYWFGHKEL